MKHKEIIGVFLALLIICTFILSSDAKALSLRNENGRYTGEHINATISLSTAKSIDKRDADVNISEAEVESESIPILNNPVFLDIHTSKSPKPSDTTVTEKPKPTDTIESGGPQATDMTGSVRPKTSVISLVKIPETGDDLELIACVLMLLISCLAVMVFTIIDRKRDSRNRS
jgi:hypothetical protein